MGSKLQELKTLKQYLQTFYLAASMPGHLDNCRNIFLTCMNCLQQVKRLHRSMLTINCNVEKCIQFNLFPNIYLYGSIDPYGK